MESPIFRSLILQMMSTAYKGQPHQDANLSFVQPQYAPHTLSSVQPQYAPHVRCYIICGETASAEPVGKCENIFAHHSLQILVIVG